MRIANFVTIIGLAWAMSAYAAWVRHEREKRFDLRGDTTKQLPLVRLQEAKTLWHRPHTIFVDVRSAAEFRQGHIAGALWLPDDDAELDRLVPRLKRAKTIVVYCRSVQCAQSLWAAIRLRNRGLFQTVIFPAGWYEWRRQNLPISTSD